MFNTIKVWGEVKDLFQSIKLDITKNKGMWLAYAFLLTGMLAVIIACVLLFSASITMFLAINSVDPEFFFDNPIPLFVYGGIVYAAYISLKEVHVVYKELRKIIKKGNR